MTTHTDCSCDLCVKRARCHGIFVQKGESFLCDDCIPLEGDLFDRLGDSDVEVWEEGSDGWNPGTVLTCRLCSRNIEIIDNAGTEEDDDD